MTAQIECASVINGIPAGTAAVAPAPAFLRRRRGAHCEVRGYAQSGHHRPGCCRPQRRRQRRLLVGLSERQERRRANPQLRRYLPPRQNRRRGTRFRCRPLHQADATQEPQDHVARHALRRRRRRPEHPGLRPRPRTRKPGARRRRHGHRPGPRRSPRVDARPGRIVRRCRQAGNNAAGPAAPARCSRSGF